MKAARTLVLFVLLGGCGGTPPPPPQAATTAEAPAPEAGPQRSMQLEGQLGSMDPREFDKAFDGVLSQLQRCHTQRLEQIRWLSGDVTFFLRVGEDGRVRHAYLEQTTLGDRATELCMMHVLLDTPWPKPAGGEAEVRKSLGFDAPNDVRAPTTWSSDEITSSLAAESAKIRACRASASGAFTATAYVVPAGAAKGPPPRPKAAAGKKKGGRQAAPSRGKPDPKSRGRVLAVGMAAPNADGANSIDCLVDALKQMPVPSPGSYAAKVTFSL